MNTIPQTCSSSEAIRRMSEAIRDIRNTLRCPSSVILCITHDLQGQPVAVAEIGKEILHPTHIVVATWDREAESVNAATYQRVCVIP